MAKSPRKLSLVKFQKKWAADPTSKGLPFIDDMPLIFLGEIPNMPEHGVLRGTGAAVFTLAFTFSSLLNCPKMKSSQFIATPNPSLNLAPFGRWTLRNKAAQRRLALR